MRWLRGQRPPKPETWDKDVATAKESAEQWAKGKQTKPCEFEDLWSKHKASFSKLTRSKCAYCELPIAADDKGGDLDHYRPKGAITKLSDDPATWGREIDGHNRRDRRFTRTITNVARGYYWLAYDWNNYVFSCGTCNSKWKGNLFPIQGGHQGNPTPATTAKEIPLLLNPYGKIDPAEHLEFEKSGLVTERNGSDIGFETIRVCGLGRDSLLGSRRYVAQLAWGRLNRLKLELRQEPINKPRLRRAIGDVLRMGNPDAPHAGMVRILWQQMDPFGIPWDILRKLRAALPKARGASGKSPSRRSLASSF